MLHDFIFCFLVHRKLTGLVIKPTTPEQINFSRADIKMICSAMRTTARALIGAADLKRIKSHGNRFNAKLVLYHVALYRSLVKQGLADDYAIELGREIGWSFYAGATRTLYCLVRPFIWNKQKQINTILRILMIFPFSRDPNGYQFKVWNESDHLRTDWTQCVALNVVERVGDDADLNFFRNSWCTYDFRFPALISKDGYYEREHTLSSGDGVCDMKWYARKPD